MIYIFGGISCDFIFTKEKFSRGTSNPSRFNYRIGGVGYNIFKFLEIKQKLFISIIGNDPFGKIIVNNIDNQEVNIATIEDISNIKNIEKNIIDNIPKIIFLMSEKYPTSIYNTLMENGDCYVATADFRIIEENLNFSNILPFLEKIEEKDICILDSNIDNFELEKILLKLKTKKCKIFFETISMEKAKRAKEVLKDIYFTSPDIHEFNSLVEGNTSVFEYMEKQNIEYILKTQGPDGAILYKKKDKNSFVFKPSRVLDTKDTTGAGDFLFAKVVESIANGFSIKESITIGMEKVLDYLYKINNIWKY